MITTALVIWGLIGFWFMIDRIDEFQESSTVRGVWLMLFHGPIVWAFFAFSLLCVAADFLRGKPSEPPD